MAKILIKVIRAISRAAGFKPVTSPSSITPSATAPLCNLCIESFCSAHIYIYLYLFLKQSTNFGAFCHVKFFRTSPLLILSRIQTSPQPSFAPTAINLSPRTPYASTSNHCVAAINHRLSRRQPSIDAFVVSPASSRIAIAFLRVVPSHALPRTVPHPALQRTGVAAARIPHSHALPYSVLSKRQVCAYHLPPQALLPHRHTTSLVERPRRSDACSMLHAIVFSSDVICFICLIGDVTPACC